MGAECYEVCEASFVCGHRAFLHWTGGGASRLVQVAQRRERYRYMFANLSGGWLGCSQGAVSGRGVQETGRPPLTTRFHGWIERFRKVLV